MSRSLPQVRIRTFLILIAVIAINIPISERLHSRWMFCQKQARLYREQAALHRDAATWAGNSPWAIANQHRKAQRADEISRDFRWAAISPLRSTPAELLRRQD